MQYGDAVVVLEGMIKALESHIELAKKGLIQEDCIGCREKDLETYKDILEVLQKEHSDKNGWWSRSMEWQLKTSKLAEAFEIVKKKKIDFDMLLHCIEVSENPLDQYNALIFCPRKLKSSEYKNLCEVMELCPDSQIAK